MSQDEIVERLKSLADVIPLRTPNAYTAGDIDVLFYAAARLSALPERELLREALEALDAIARADIGGMQGISEQHMFDPTDYSPEDAYDRLQAWRDDEVRYLMYRISDRRTRARAAADKIRAALERQQKGEPKP